MKLLDNLRRLIGLETDIEKVERYNELKKSFDEVSLKLDNLADDFMIQKSDYTKRLKNPENQSIKLRIKEKWDEYLKVHRQEISKAKKEYDSLKNKVEDLEKSETIKKNSQIKSLQIIKKAYQDNILSLDDYNKAINKVSKRSKTLYSDFILFNENNELLLLRRSTWDTSNPGCWVVPGGHVDPGEDHETAAKRELQEETGYNVDDVINVGSYDDENCHIEYFQSTIKSDTQTPVIQFEEARDLRWVPLSELHEYEMVFNMKDNLMKILNLPNQEKTTIRKSEDVLKSQLSDLYLELGQELIKKNRQYKVLLEKGFIDEANNILDEIEKAKKDISKLKKLKKLVYRDGKLVFGTYYVKTGETTEEADKIAPAFNIKQDLVEGDSVEIKTRKAAIKGIISGFSFRKDGNHWIHLLDEGGDLKCINVESVKSYKKLDKDEDVKAIETSFDESEIPNFDELELGKILGGSSGVRLASDSKLNLYAVKNSHKENFQQLVNEYETNKIYRSLGFKVPEQKLDEKNKVLISKYLLNHKELGAASVGESKLLNEEICKGFVLDALLANWDVLGQSKDNILYDSISDYSESSNKIVRVDNSGSLKFRARGGTKPFNTAVGEIKTLRENNPGKEVYSTITDSDITEQISFLIKNRDKINVSNKLNESDEINKTLQARIDWLAETYKVHSIEVLDKLLSKKKIEKKETLRSDMPSLTTQKYFDEKFDKLVNISGNAGIKEHIKKHIVEIENKHKSRYESIAVNKGMTVEEFKQDFQKAVEDIVGRSKGYIVAHSSVSEKIRGKEHGVVGAVLSEKRFKTQFETGTSSGCLSSRSRSRTEEGYFGFDDFIEKANMRPIYGFFTDNDHGAINEYGTVPPPRRVEQYGDICFEVKEEKFRKDATVTFRDSLHDYREITASPVVAPHFTSVTPEYYYKIKEMQSGKVSGSESGYGYVEAQYHGQLTLDDIDKIHISIESYGHKADLNKVVNEVVKYTTIGGKPIPVELF